MGVRGLTSYIARNAEKYLHPFELHDTDLVIDGDNLACNLYKNCSECNSAFGGDYDEYYRTVVNFFEILSQCNIRPYVLLDGGYENKKLKTVEHRLRAKIAGIKCINPVHSRPLFPLMMRETFIDAARDCEVSIMRCVLEADEELAVLSRKLNCPILSYDSDFYIHNVKYIPVITLTLRVLTKSSIEQTASRPLSSSKARYLMKRNRIEGKDLENPGGEHSGRKQKTINYLDCCIYSIENLISGSLDRAKLPIFAALLGNDYIERSAFRSFYSHIGLKGSGKKLSLQQRRIKVILKWLKYETKESAIEKILSRLKKGNREKLLAQIHSASDGYNNERCVSFDYFGLDENDYVQDKPDENGDDSNEEFESDDEDEEEEDKSSEVEDEEQDDEIKSDAGVDEVDHILKTDEESESLSERESETTCYETGRSEKSSTEIDKEPVTEDDFEDWFVRRVHKCDFPRFFIDLAYLRLYINNPQIEHFVYEDANSVSLDILRYIFTLINCPETPDLKYLTRVVQQTKVNYKMLQPFILEKEYNPDLIDLEGFKTIFRGLPFYEKIFKSIQLIPENLKLYFYAIFYWSVKSKHADHLHLYSLIICMIILNTIDSKVEPIRDERKFQKKFGKIIQKFRNIQAKESTEENENKLNTKKEEKTRRIQNLQKNLSPYEKIKYISKTECLLVQESLLKYFHLNEAFRKRHNDFSSSILHGFSEFQSVFFNLYSLNILLNFPFKTIRISQFYCGIFLYNIYVNLKNRTNIKHYVKNHIFRDSSIMFEYYEYLINWCKEFIPLINNENENIKLNQRKSKKKKSSSSSTKAPVAKLTLDIDYPSDVSDFEDLNNKFSFLLKVNK